MKKIGIDAAQCAEGLRTSATMKKLGVNANQFKAFINEVYKYCERFGLIPLDIGSNLQVVSIISFLFCRKDKRRY